MVISMKILIKQIQMVDVIKGDINKRDILIDNGIFEKIAEKIMIDNVEDVTIIDGQDFFALPGLIDAHTHVELSLLSSVSFAECLIKNGTTSTVLDPHDVINVLGHKGAKYLMDEMKGTCLKTTWMASPCVPSAPAYEDCYGSITIEDIQIMIEKYGMQGIAEAMDYNRVIEKEEELAKILKYAKNKGLMIDGHAPCVLGTNLDIYIEAGVKTDHESITLDEMLEKYNKGMYVILRRGSLQEPTSGKDLVDVIGNSERILLSTDGCITTKDMIGKGHMNYALSQLVEEGVAPIRAVQMATIYPAKAYGMKNVGVIAEGKIADLVMVKDLKDFAVEKVLINGHFAPKKFERENYPQEVLSTIKRDLLRKEELEIPISIDEGRVLVHIVEIVDGALETKHEMRMLQVKNSRLVLEEDLLYCAVVNRYESNGSVGLGIISNAGKLRGALAGSIAQDTQNLIVLGSNVEDMQEAINHVIEKQGGVAYALNRQIESFIPLPVMGILTQEPIEVLNAQIEKLNHILYNNGLILSNPILTLSLQIALAVIPEMAITNRGLLHIDKDEFIPVYELV